MIYRVLLFMLLSVNVFGQGGVRDTTINILSFDFGGGYQSPGGDMADRFGSNANISLGMKLKTQQNFVFSVEGSFLFGPTVRENVASAIRTDDGNIIDENGDYVNLLVLQRGMTFTANAGMIFPLLGPNDNSGLLFQVGLGMLQHNIRLETRANDVPSLEGDYVKGYDRLSNGLTMHQLLGYQYYGNNRLVNFFVGIEGYQAYTQSRRDYNYDLMAKDETKRRDSLYGVKVIWSVPIRSGGTRTIIYK